jgi:molybdenum cofactor cytidylyltransferase
MIEAVVLAAGLSSRMSSYKMTLPLGEKTVIEHTVDTLMEVCGKVYVVAGYRADECREVLRNRKNVKVVENPDYQKGMFVSVQRGVKHVTSDTFFITPGDQPMVKPATLRKMLKSEGDIVNPAYKGKKGHPVLFQNNCHLGILSMPENATLRDFIHSRWSNVVEVDDEGILLDIDTDEDYECIKKKFSEK